MTLALKEIDGASGPSRKKPPRQPKRTLSALEKFSPDDMKTLRLDEAQQAELDGLIKRFGQSRDILQPFQAEDAGAMSDARYAELTDVQNAHSGAATAVVRFLAPRILRLREGDAKRKWRAFLTKFRKDEQLG